MNTSKSLPSTEQLSDQTETIDRVFYEAVVLQSLLGPQEESKISRSSLEDGEKATRTPWHDFLDNLAWLGDYKCGGKTVTSIAAENRSHGPIFWVACNQHPKAKALDHLEKVLQELQSLSNSSKADTEHVQRRIFERSIRFSYPRVENYARKLCGFIELSKKLLAKKPEASGGYRHPSLKVLYLTPIIDRQLQKYLEDLVMSRSNHEKLCQLAYNFHRSAASKCLSGKLDVDNSSSVWLLTRHYIGRLGSWWKACVVLTDVARLHPRRLDNFAVTPVRVARAKKNLPLITESDFIHVLGRLFPTYDSGQLKVMLRSIRDRLGSDIDNKFAQRFTHKNFRPRVHAEVSLLEHFHAKERTFVGSDRYIGCSKPSCYCCNLYMRFHPGSYLPRPCHGNTWINWSTPVYLNSQTSPEPADIGNIMQQMLRQIRKDITLQLGSTSHDSSWMPDSTTGFSASVSGPSLHMNK